MAKKTPIANKKNLAIILLIAVLFQLINIPFIDEKMISTLLVLAVAIYMFIK